MQIVIDIPKEKYDLCKKWKPSERSELQEAVANGTPLPKGHGRLIDADRLRSMYSINRANFNTVVGIQKWIDDAPAIIKADEAEQGQKGRKYET